MSHTHEHLEHAEHAQHAAHSGFDRRVAMSIALIAAILAGVSVLAHRTHNDVLRLQNESAVKEVNASNGFAWYQATRVRQQAMEINRDSVMLTAPDGPARTTLIQNWEKKITEYKSDLAERKASAEKDKAEAKRLADEAHFKHAQGNRFDIAHLAVELGLVLGSIAVLTKRKAFWLTGIACCLIGVAITVSALTMSPHHDDHAHEKPVSSSSH